LSIDGRTRRDLRGIAAQLCGCKEVVDVRLQQGWQLLEQPRRAELLGQHSIVAHRAARAASASPALRQPAHDECPIYIPRTVCMHVRVHACPRARRRAEATDRTRARGRASSAAIMPQCTFDTCNRCKILYHAVLDLVGIPTFEQFEHFPISEPTVLGIPIYE
jgi:hypothetical protein